MERKGPYVCSGDLGWSGGHGGGEDGNGTEEVGLELHVEGGWYLLRLRWWLARMI